MSRKLSRTLSSLLIALAIAFTGVTPAAAQPPTNDDFDHATVIPALPYSDAMDTSYATEASDDPHSCASGWHSVWYSLTPATDMTIEANTDGSDFDTVLSVFTGSRESLNAITCNNDHSYWTLASRVKFAASANVTYYFLIASWWDYGGGNLSFSVQAYMPPANDDFDDATLIPALPFNEGPVDMLGATRANDDPQDCYWDDNSVWYSFTPSTDVTIEANTLGSDYDTVLSVYTGSRGELTLVRCTDDPEFVRFYAKADVTYYFKIASYSDLAGNLVFSVQEYMPQQDPVVEFYMYPEDPSVFDTVDFCSSAYDPEYLTIELLEWNFGDGKTSTDNCASHQYATDGNYTVMHTAKTEDGRSVSITQVVQVRTHDVAITRILAPVAAKAGQTRSITVYVKSLRYAETVQVALYKSVPGGTEWLGDSPALTVPATNRTTAFAFPYTFTSEDAGVGKVTFWAFATIVDARDALPADNEAISSPPTRVIK